MPWQTANKSVVLNSSAQALRWLYRQHIDALMLALLERLVLQRPWKCGAPQLFILGLPRSGTTLVYQYIVHRLRVAYFTNGVGRYPKSPCVVTTYQRLIHPAYCSDFESNYGKVKGPRAPREAGAFWGRFFDFDAYTAADELDRGNVDLLRRSIALLQLSSGGLPFVNKNVKHLLRVAPLAAIFPQALFLVVQRDHADVALSILRARHTQSNDPSRWWSLRPPDYEALKCASVVEQIAGQVVSAEARLEADLAALGDGRVITTRYEGFCANPEEVVATVKDVLGGVPHNNPPVPSFVARSTRPRTDEEHGLVELVKSIKARSLG